jgi:predicted small lipoprotein YifL
VRRALVLLVAAVGVAGCGGGGTLSFDPAASAATTAKEKSAKVAFDTKVAGGGQTLRMTGDGSVDFQNQGARMTFDVGDLLRGSGLPASANERWTILTQGPVLYMHAPTLAQQLPGGQEWLKVNVEALAKSRRIDLGQFRQLTQSDPAQMLAYLRAAGGKIEKVGEEKVRGVDTTHYKAEVDLDKVAGQAPPSLRQAFRTSIQSLERGLGTHTIPVDVWVDENDLVRRLEEHLPVAGGGKIDFAVDFFDFGTPVSVTPPPAAQTLDLGTVLGG